MPRATEKSCDCASEIKSAIPTAICTRKYFSEICIVAWAISSSERYSKKRRDELLKAREIRHAKARQKVYRESLTDCIMTSMEIAARADAEAEECFREFREKIELAETERLLEQIEM